MDIFLACPDPVVAQSVQHALGRIDPSTHVVTVDLPACGPGPFASGTSIVFVYFDGNVALACQDIEQARHLGASKIVAIGRDADSRQILALVRAGADDYMALGVEFESELATLMNRFRVAQHDHVRGQVVSLLGCCGGVGASTVATNLAAILAKDLGSCGLIDLKLNGGDLATLLKLNPQHSVADVLEKAHAFDQEMFAQSLTKHPTGIELLAGPDPFAAPQPLSGPGIEQILRTARQRFPATVVEVDGLGRAEQIEILAESDSIVVVMRLDFLSLARAYRLLRYLSGEGIDTSAIRLVANRQGLPMEIEPLKIEKALERKVDHCIPDDPGPVVRSINLGIPLVFESEASKASRAIIRLANELMGKAVPDKTPRRTVFTPFRQAASSVSSLFPSGRSSQATS